MVTDEAVQPVTEALTSRPIAPWTGFLLSWRLDGSPLASAGSPGAPGAGSGQAHWSLVAAQPGAESPGREPGVAVAGERFHLALHGRIDNRAEVRDALGLSGRQRPTDAELVLSAFRRWGEAALPKLVGPWALALVDAEEGRLLCAADPMGSRSLLYTTVGRTLSVAVDEEVLLDLPGVSADVDEGTIARFSAIRPAAPGRTFFKDLRELDPGHRMALSLEHPEPGIRRFWSPEPGATVRYRRDREYAEHFRELLAECVRVRLPPEGPASVLMSGGLDSTAVAALASRELAGSGRRLTTLSWVFDELPESDEREFMEPAVRALGSDPVWIRGDGLWPLGGDPGSPGAVPVGRRSPYSAIYRRLLDRAYGEVAARGGGTILTGEGGDELFVGGELWLRDLLAEGRFDEALRGVGSMARRHRSHRLGLGGSLAAVLTRGGFSREFPRPWLTPEARRLAESVAEPGAGSARRSPREQAALDRRMAPSLRQEAAFAAFRGVEVRRPLRDRRLVEFMLALPAHQLHRPGWTKWLTRQAMGGLLPDAVRLRRRRSSLFPLFLRGVGQREHVRARALLESPHACWFRFIRSEWLWQRFPRDGQSVPDGPAALVAWQCLCLELWLRGVDAEGIRDRARSPATMKPGGGS